MKHVGQRLSLICAVKNGRFLGSFFDLPDSRKKTATPNSGGRRPKLGRRRGGVALLARQEIEIFGIFPGGTMPPERGGHDGRRVAMDGRYRDTASKQRRQDAARGHGCPRNSPPGWRPRRRQAAEPFCQSKARGRRGPGDRVARLKPPRPQRRTLGASRQRVPGRAGDGERVPSAGPSVRPSSQPADRLELSLALPVAAEQRRLWRRVLPVERQDAA